MGRCSSTAVEGDLVRHQQISPQHPEDTLIHLIHAEASEMAEGSQKTDFNSYLEANDVQVKMAKEIYERYDKLYYGYCELKSSNERLMKENESLRKRYVDDILL